MADGIHLMGRAERLTDAEQHAMIDRIFEENPSMNEVYPGETNYILEPLLLRRGALSSLISGKVPSAVRVLRLEKLLLRKKTFSSRRSVLVAIRVQVFARSSASRMGTPYVIAVAHCLLCGLCYESCPVEAIERLGNTACQYSVFCVMIF